MDVAQFNEYQQNLARAAQERQIQYDQSTRTNAIEKITAKLLKQTTFCDGSSDVATRAWLDDIDLAFQRVGQAYVVDIVSSSVTGSLRKAPFTLGNLRRQQQTPTSLPIRIAGCLRVYTGRRCAEVGVALLCDAACDVRR